ncbi:hypothetical protein [Mycolicibacterium aichiense]|uniref:Uncharacterized protein n=1 Tax=Mycolicibacterium aichiense TaxID=1799 RepID=A0AAD1MBB4_9MYCO|nr:hypothetical protein [Mycolicibacterium aichiense]MCV7017857.1 hypothetical protein [Mycolicibacterium aichiense]BBX06526.1 hypothetical protein MAIC_13290 [Mycolicibacterium aichiense]STZ24138.1 Uncharacterised protein [Mycolicibacterium aichiense]
MAKRYEPTYFSKEHRYSMGNDLKTGGHYLAIPVSNGLAEYNEEYFLLPGQYEEFMRDPSAALKFVEACRARQHDEQLIYVQNGKRGEPL